MNSLNVTAEDSATRFVVAQPHRALTARRGYRKPVEISQKTQTQKVHIEETSRGSCVTALFCPLRVKVAKSTGARLVSAFMPSYGNSIMLQ